MLKFQEPFGIVQGDPSNCGGEGQPCCSSGGVSITDATSDLCPAGYSEGADQSLVCDRELDEPSCIACGKVNQACCRDSGVSTFTCDNGNACASGMCKTCGDLNQTCCHTGGVSITDATSDLCPAGYSEGADQSLVCDTELDEPSCIACGKVNQACCRDSGVSTFTCDNGNACASGMCKTCGDLNQTCCHTGGVSITDATSDLCPAGDSEGADQSLVCDRELDEPSCIACGKVNQACCRDSGVSTPTCEGISACISDACAVCGGLGQPCCPVYDEECPGVPGGPRLTCSGSGPSTCLACGAAGQPCCQGGTAPPCSAGTTCGEEGTCGGCGRLGEPCCSETSDLPTQCVYAGVVLLSDHPSAAS